MVESSKNPSFYNTIETREFSRMLRGLHVNLKKIKYKQYLVIKINKYIFLLFLKGYLIKEIENIFSVFL